MIRKITPMDQGINARPRFVQRVQPNQIQMTTPQKLMHPTGMVQPPVRFQAPVRVQRQVTPTVRTPKPPRTPTVRQQRAQAIARAQINTQSLATPSTPLVQPRQRLTLTRVNNAQITQVQPIISMGHPKTMVSIATPPRAPSLTRAQAPVVYNKPVTQAQIQNTVTAAVASTSKNVDEDLEDSITAFGVTKQPTTPTQSTQQQLQHPAGADASIPQQITDNNEHRIITLQRGTVTQTATVKQLAGIRPINRGIGIAQNRQTRFVTPNTNVRGPRPVLVGCHVAYEKEFAFFLQI